tara:strand:+ start:5339 stop:5629 length:291 start_codon:yes stop_codon:yes gene_type:complete
MQVKIKVQTQYFENISLSSVPCFKPRGGQEFIFPCDSDFVMGVELNELVETIEVMLKNYSNAHYKYEYMSHDIEFHEPIVIENIDYTHDVIFGEVK